MLIFISSIIKSRDYFHNSIAIKISLKTSPHAAPILLTQAKVQSKCSMIKQSQWTKVIKQIRENYKEKRPSKMEIYHRWLFDHWVQWKDLNKVIYKINQMCFPVLVSLAQFQICLGHSYPVSDSFAFNCVQQFGTVEQLTEACHLSFMSLFWKWFFGLSLTHYNSHNSPISNSNLGLHPEWIV